MFLLITLEKIELRSCSPSLFAEILFHFQTSLHFSKIGWNLAKKLIVLVLYWKILPYIWGFLVAYTRLYKSPCRSVRPSVRRSVPVYFFSPKGDLTSVIAPAQRTRLMHSRVAWPISGVKSPIYLRMTRKHLPSLLTYHFSKSDHLLRIWFFHFFLTIPKIWCHAHLLKKINEELSVSISRLY